jgi:transcriptional regulatory protein AMDR
MTPDQEIVSCRQIHKGVRITYVGKDISNINFLIRERQGQSDESVHHFPSYQIARKYMRYESDRIVKDAFLLPERGLADELIHAYFAHINPGFPLVDEGEFMAQYRGQIRLTLLHFFYFKQCSLWALMSRRIAQTETV